MAYHLDYVGSVMKMQYQIKFHWQFGSVLGSVFQLHD